MKRIIIPAAAAFLLAAAAPAMAEGGEHGDRGGQHGGQGGQHSAGPQGGQHGNQQSGQTHGTPQNFQRSAPQNYQRTAPQNFQPSNTQTGSRGYQHGDHFPTTNGAPNQNFAPQGGSSHGVVRPQWNNQQGGDQHRDWRDNRGSDWRNGSRPDDSGRYQQRYQDYNRGRDGGRHDFDRHAWERNYHAEHRYHWRDYDRPSGWYYRQWSFGMYLPGLFWSRNYWIDSYYDFDLPEPPYGYVWVRYGDDALLIDEESGYILQVRYGVFY